MLSPPSEDARYAQLERRIRQLETALRSSFTTISGGAGLRIVDGGTLALVAADGTVVFYIGPVFPSLPDGSPQPGWEVRRADGTVILSMRDAFPGVDGTLNQALNWCDRSGNVVLADDTNSGQGIARPWGSDAFVPARFGDWTMFTASTQFETIWRSEVIKQHPRRSVATLASMDTAGATGEIRVLVDGAPLGPPQTIGYALTTSLFGPAAVAGAHMSLQTVEIQGRCASGTGALRLQWLHNLPRQS